MDAIDRVLVIGAGAMGSLIGARLATAGASVTLYDLNTAHMEAIARDGLHIGHDGALDEHLRVDLATSDAAEVAPVDLALVMTKSWATTDAVRSVTHAIGPDTFVVSAQNGLGNGRRIADVVPAAQVWEGTTTIGATMVRPGVVDASGTVTHGSSLTQFGAPAGVPISTGDPIAALFEAAGLHAELLEDVGEVVWTKLCMAGTAGCLTALAQITIGDMIASTEAMRTWRAMLDEIFAVAEAEGVTLDRGPVAEHAMTTYRTVGNHWASMAVDIRGRRRTEVDAMCGEVSRLGATHGVPTPVNDTVANMIRAIEQSWGPRE